MILKVSSRQGLSLRSGFVIRFRVHPSTHLSDRVITSVLLAPSDLVLLSSTPPPFPT